MLCGRSYLGTAVDVPVVSGRRFSSCSRRDADFEGRVRQFLPQSSRGSCNVYLISGSRFGAKVPRYSAMYCGICHVFPQLTVGVNLKGRVHRFIVYGKCLVSRPRVTVHGVKCGCPISQMLLATSSRRVHSFALSVASLMSSKNVQVRSLALADSFRLLPVRARRRSFDWRSCSGLFSSWRAEETSTSGLLLNNFQAEQKLIVPLSWTSSLPDTHTRSWTNRNHTRAKKCGHICSPVVSTLLENRSPIPTSLGSPRNCGRLHETFHRPNKFTASASRK